MLLALFRDTIRRVNCRDYSPAQVAAWASDDIDADAWFARFTGRFVPVAEEADRPVGFAELEPSGHIDRVYVSADHQQRGIGRQLLAAVVAEARRVGLARLFTEASITARPFFEAQGFAVLASQAVMCRGVEFVNYRMERVLSEPGAAAGRVPCSGLGFRTHLAPATAEFERSATGSEGTLAVELISLNVGLPQTFGPPDSQDAKDKSWTTGFFKEPVAGPVRLGRTNLAGDGQADLKCHGGPEKAVNVYPAEHYAYWQDALGIAKLPAAAFGENFTTRGALEEEVCIGDVFQIGDALVQLSQPRQPCWKLARRWRVKDLAVQVQQTGRTGWYFRVLREGAVEAGAELRLIERPHPEWSVAAANEVMHYRKQDLAAARSLAECPLLSDSWRASLSRRAATGESVSTEARLEGASE